ncbi:MAG: DnaA regulatory inactivator Hda [Pseudomonadota bacterium]
MPSLSEQLALQVSLDVEARFDTFFAGHNATVVEALQAIPAPGVWLAGASGSGRSHLLQAAAAMHAAGDAFYLPLAGDLPSDAIDGLPGTLLVCLDDVDRVATDATWEQQLFALYERIVAAGGRLVLSAPSRPNRCGFALADLISRFQSLALFRLHTLDDDGLKSALEMRARARGLTMTSAAVGYLLKHLPRSMPVLLDSLTQLEAQAIDTHRKLTLPFVREQLRASDH